MAVQRRVQLYTTAQHACGYYPQRLARNLVIDPFDPALPRIYGQSLTQGYRRSGDQVYKPQCASCNACVACRILVARFKPSRSQRRCLQRNADLDIAVLPAGFTEERFDLYRRYLHSRHRGGGMDDATQEDFERFLCTGWSPTRFIELRLAGELLAVAATDFCTTGLSAVYTWFAPGHESRSLGTFGVLKQIAVAQQHQLPHVYLGFWIAKHPKMHYKTRFRPLQVLQQGTWSDLGQVQE